jgi:hypothetical protein
MDEPRVAPKKLELTGEMTFLLQTVHVVLGFTMLCYR